MKRRISVKYILVFILCTSLVLPLVPRMKTIVELTGRKAVLMEKKAELQERNNELQAQLEAADSLETIERLARERLGMVRQGEKVLVAVPQDSQ